MEKLPPCSNPSPSRSREERRPGVLRALIRSLLGSGSLNFLLASNRGASPLKGIFTLQSSPCAVSSAGRALCAEVDCARGFHGGGKVSGLWAQTLTPDVLGARLPGSRSYLESHADLLWTPDLPPTGLSFSFIFMFYLIYFLLLFSYTCPHFPPITLSYPPYPPPPTVLFTSLFLLKQQNACNIRVLGWS